MPQNLRAYEMVEGTSPDEISLMKQQRRIEEAQRLRRQKQISRQAMLKQRLASGQRSAKAATSNPESLR